MKGGRTPVHVSAAKGDMLLVQYLIEEWQAAFTTLATNGATPISDAKRRGHTNVVQYLQLQGMKIVMGIESDILPFYTDVRNIILKYWQ